MLSVGQRKVASEWPVVLAGQEPVSWRLCIS